jgi:putative tryptophan/tyrosine transport system substrate-binding protein
MNRRRVLLVLARGLAGLTAGTLGSQLAPAADTAQRVVRMGLIGMESPSNAPRGLHVFWQRLHELGWIEGQNLIVEQRWAEGHLDRLPALMAEVIERNVDVIVTGSTPGAIAAKNATSTIPIVAIAMGDPVRSGVVASLARPGGNLTGTSMGYGEDFSGKWLQLLQETVPRLTTVAMIVNPDNSVGRDLAKDAEAIAPKRQLKVEVIEVREAQALDGAFEQARRQAQAVLVHADGLITLRYQGQITALAAKLRLPAIYNSLAFVDSGGLMAYAPDLTVQFQRAADYVDKILRGAKPADLPIEQPTQYVLVVNLKTAKGLGLSIPQSILLQANKVIQ